MKSKKKISICVGLFIAYLVKKTKSIEKKLDNAVTDSNLLYFCLNAVYMPQQSYPRRLVHILHS